MANPLDHLTSKLLEHLTREGVSRPRTPSQSAIWRFLTELGVSGNLAALLNERALPATDLPVSDELDLRELLDSAIRNTAQKQQPFRRSPWGMFRVLSELGAELRNELRHTGWPGVQLRLLWHSVGNRPSLRGIWILAMTEIPLFACASFDIAWCRYGGHWYVRDDVRRKSECIKHREAAWQARHRQAEKPLMRENPQLL